MTESSVFMHYVFCRILDLGLSKCCRKGFVYMQQVYNQSTPETHSENFKNDPNHLTASVP